jgi:hypothetical protein
MTAKSPKPAVVKKKAVQYKVIGVTFKSGRLEYQGTLTPQWIEQVLVIASGLPEETDAITVVQNIVASGDWYNLQIVTEEIPSPTGM